MRLIFCGSGGFGLPTLEALVRAGHEVATVVTQPPRRAGRGKGVRPTPVAEAAEDLGLPVRPVEDINAPAEVAALKALAADATVVVDFGQVIRKAARNAARLRSINLHGSVLPALRGAAPVNWAIIRGYPTTGVTVFRIVRRMDAGPIFSIRQTPLEPGERADELRDRLAVLGVETVLEALDLLAADARPRPQDESRATLAPRLAKADGRLDFGVEAVELRNLIHGTWPWPAAQATYYSTEGKATAVQIARAAAHPGPPVAPPGEVLEDGSVAAGAGRIEILEIKPAGKRLMRWRQFANGYRAGSGASFGPPT
jgi:methionyl-tRNA formyltransferase